MFQYKSRGENFRKMCLLQRYILFGHPVLMAINTGVLRSIPDWHCCQYGWFVFYRQAKLEYEPLHMDPVCPLHNKKIS